MLQLWQIQQFYTTFIAWLTRQCNDWTWVSSKISPWIQSSEDYLSHYLLIVFQHKTANETPRNKQRSKNILENGASKTVIALEYL